MLDGDLEWVSQDECRDMGHLLNYADGRIAIFDTKLFNYWENENDKTSFIFELDLEYPPELYERVNDYPLALDVTSIEP